MPTILLKKSDTASSVPSTANLTNLAGGAEVAVNTADKRLFTMNSSSAVVELGTNPSSLTVATGANLATTSGNVGIGTTSPTRQLSISNASQSNIQLTTTGAGGTITDGFQLQFDGSSNYVWGYENVPTLFGTNNTERARITATGNLLVGTTTDLSGSGSISDIVGNVRNIPASSSKSAAYTLATTDIGTFILTTSGTITVPNNTFAAGNAVSVFNNSASAISLTISTTTGYIGGTNTNRTGMTLATRGVCTVLFVNPSLCVVTGNVT